MTRNSFVTVLCLAAAGFNAPAAAQDIYRCGDSYSQRPCAGGVLVPADDARSAAQRAQTSEAAQRDARMADAMEKARLKEEAKPVQVYIPPAKSEDPAQEHRKPASFAKATKPAHFTAVAPKKPGATSAKNKKKAKKKAA